MVWYDGRPQWNVWIMCQDSASDLFFWTSLNYKLVLHNFLPNQSTTNNIMGEIGIGNFRLIGSDLIYWMLFLQVADSKFSWRTSKLWNSMRPGIILYHIETIPT